MTTFLTIIHILACLILVALVLVQSGKGAEISASFAGSSQTVFGSSGGANFFTRATASCAAIFMVTSVLLTLQANKTVVSGMKSRPAPIAAPAQPAAATPAAEAKAPATAAPAAKAPAPEQKP